MAVNAQEDFLGVMPLDRGENFLLLLFREAVPVLEEFFEFLFGEEGDLFGLFDLSSVITFWSTFQLLFSKHSFTRAGFRASSE